MAHLWHNPDLVGWLSLGVGLIGVLAALLAPRLWQPRRELTYLEHSRTPLPDLPGSATGRSLGAPPQLVWDGRPVRDVSFLDVELRNTGGVALRPGEFERPLALSFGPDARVLTLLLPPDAPGAPAVQPSVQGGGVLVSPLLLNPGEAVRLQAFVSHAAPEASLDVRIADLPPVRRGLSRSTGRRRFLRDWVLVCSAGMAASGAWLALLGREHAAPTDFGHVPGETAANMALTVSGLMLILPGVYVFRDWADVRFRRRYGL